jgi:hypothetical protein
MTKDESERAIRGLCHEWAGLTGIPTQTTVVPDFGAFYRWLQDGYPQLLRFRSCMSVRYDVEMWFDDEFKQNWRN